MNSSDRRTMARWRMRELVNGRHKPTGYGHLPHYFRDYIMRTPDWRKTEIVHQLLEIGKSRGGTDMQSCLGKLHEDERAALRAIVGDQAKSLEDRVTIYLLTPGIRSTQPPSSAPARAAGRA